MVSLEVPNPLLQMLQAKNFVVEVDFLDPLNQHATFEMRVVEVSVFELFVPLDLS